MIKNKLTSNEIAELLSISKRGVNKRAKSEKWISRTYSVRGGKENRYEIAKLPEDIQTAYAASIKITLTDLQSQLKPASMPSKKINLLGYSGRGAKTADIKTIKNTPDKYLQIAASKYKILEAYLNSGLSASQFVTAYKNNVIVPEVKSELAEHGEISSQSSLYRWLARYEQHGLAGLAPQYAKRRGGSGASLDERAKELIQALFLTSNRPSIASVVRSINENNLLGSDLNDSIARRYIDNEIPNSVKVFYRYGKKAYSDRFDPYIQRDYTLMKSMEWGCGDHHLLDFVINHNGRIFRPWLTMFIDMRSRKITGWHIDVVPNTLTIMRAFSMSVETCGLFDNLLIDNGKDFKSAWFAGNEWKLRRTNPEKGTLELIEGVLHDCGTKAHFSTPYHAQSKPIERAFRTIIELFSKEQPTWVGSNTSDRPADTNLFWSKINGRDRIEVTYTLYQLREDFEKFVAWFNASWKHSGQGMNGATPDSVFTANLETKREMPEEMRKYVFAIREQRTVRKSGINIDGIDYYNEELVRLIGERVEVRRDINDAGKISIFSLPDCVYQFDAENDLLKDRGIPEENIRRLKSAKKKSRAHLQDYAKGASEIRRTVKSPAELLAEKNRPVKERQAVGGQPLRSPAQPFPVKPKPKRKLRSILGE